MSLGVFGVLVDSDLPRRVLHNAALADSGGGAAEAGVEGIVVHVDLEVVLQTLHVSSSFSSSSIKSASSTSISASLSPVALNLRLTDFLLNSIERPANDLAPNRVQFS